MLEKDQWDNNSIFLCSNSKVNSRNTAFTLGIADIWLANAVTSADCVIAMAKPLQEKNKSKLDPS